MYWSYVYFLTSDFDLSKGDIWRVDVIELKTAHRGTSKQVCGYFGESISNTVYSLNSLLMLTELAVYVRLVMFTLAGVWESSSLGI
jgi:hypothetical protein